MRADLPAGEAYAEMVAGLLRVVLGQFCKFLKNIEKPFCREYNINRGKENA